MQLLSKSSWSLWPNKNPRVFLHDILSKFTNTSHSLTNFWSHSGRLGPFRWCVLIDKFEGELSVFTSKIDIQLAFLAFLHQNLQTAYCNSVVFYLRSGNRVLAERNSTNANIIRALMWLILRFVEIVGALVFLFIYLYFWVNCLCLVYKRMIEATKWGPVRNP